MIGTNQPTAVRELELRKPVLSKYANQRGAFFWLSAFFVVYCARPEEWVPGLGYFPLAKISGLLAMLGLITSLGKTRRKLGDLPRESNYLLAMIGVLFLASLLSPIWKGGAVSATLDFAKVYIIWVLIYLLVTDMGRLRRIIYIQSASVAAISAVSLIKGHSQPRLEGVIGGIYSNPNDLAFAIVLTLPFCLAFLLSTKRTLVKFCWAGGILIMAFTLFKTASRAGFITLLISGAVCLWHFGVKGRRFYLIAASALGVVLLLAVAGGPLVRRMAAIGGKGDTEAEALAYDSYEARKDLMSLALHGIARYPILGMGTGDFQVYSGSWHDVHVAYLQIAVEGGIPSLILYLLFFGSGFKNLRELLRRRDLDPHTTLFVGALNSSLVGFVIGALFAPEAYEFFPYFAVAYTSALLAMVREREPAPEPDSDKRDWRPRYGIVRADAKKPRDFTVVR